MKTQRFLGGLVLLGVLGCLATSAFGTSIAFSTGENNNYSWTVNFVGGTAMLSFANNDIDMSSPFPDPVLNDHIGLPSMTLSNIQMVHLGPGFDIVTANLIAINPAVLAIAADVASGPAAAGDIVMTTHVRNSGMLAVGTNFIAYSDLVDDLDVIQYVSGYSDVIDQFAALDNLGFKLDLSFSGDSSGSLYNLLSGNKDGFVTGTLSGQIVIVPEPLTLILLGLGGVIFLRPKYLIFHA
jgi:hypothetical protein